VDQTEQKQINKFFTKRNVIVFIAQFFGLLLFACAFFWFLNYNNTIPHGTDVWGHVYKAQHMYNSIKEGSFYPLFDMYWYNGIETFRYWGPVSYYLYVIPLFITGGNTIMSYQLFLSLMVFLGGIPWIIMGIDSDRKWFGFFAAIMWFMLPTNIHILYAYGNVPQIATIMLTPYLLLFLRRYIYYHKDYAAFGLVIVMAIMTATHLMVTGITGLSTFIFLMISAIQNKGIKRKISALVYMVCGILVMAIWFLPALKGGMINSSDSGLAAAEVFVTELKISLDPVRRFIFGWDDFYFGLSLVVISIFGIVASNKKNKAGFIFLLLVMLMTSPTAYKLLEKVPMSGLFWMERFTPIAYVFFLSALFDWTSVKKKILFVIALILLADSVPFYAIKIQNIVVTDTVVRDVDTLLEEDISNRASLLELSAYGPYSSYKIPDSGYKYTFGWAWQGAITADNIMNINESLEAEKYLYMFDRSVELGDDTILVGKSMIPLYRVKDFVECAEKNNYELVNQTDTSYYFKLKTAPENQSFGVITKYKGLTVGGYGGMFTTRYPSVCYGDSAYIDDYSKEELLNYEVLFLTGFKYHDKTKAENLLREISDSGVRVVIDAAHLPTDSTINENYFMGVAGSKILFTNRYPVLTYNGKTLYTSDFSDEYQEFSTEFISGVDNKMGTFNIDGTEFVFLGNKNDCPNIYFLGLNIAFEAMDTEDEVLYELLDELLGITRTDLPDRTLVPITVEFNHKGLKITSPLDNVNTTIAFAECFRSSQEIRSQNNLLVVNEGVTEITYEYAMFKESAIASVIGILLTAAWTVIVKKSKQFN